MQHDVVIFDNKACPLAALGTNPLARWVGRMESVSTNRLASPPDGSPPRFMVSCSFSGAIEATPARSIFRSSLGVASGDQIGCGPCLLSDCALPRRDQPATLRSPNPVPS